MCALVLMKRHRCRKYKASNWFGAMYTYALAWGCLLPFHYDMFADDDKVKSEFGKL